MGTLSPPLHSALLLRRVRGVFFLFIFQDALEPSSRIILTRARLVRQDVPEKEAVLRLACLLMRSSGQKRAPGPGLDHLATHIMGLLANFLYIPYWSIDCYEARTAACPDVSALFSGVALDSLPTVSQRWVFEHEAFNVLPKLYQCLPPALVLLGELTAHSTGVQTAMTRDTAALRAIVSFLHLEDGMYQDLRVAALFLVATLIVNGFKYGAGPLLTQALVRTGLVAGLVCSMYDVDTTPVNVRTLALGILNHVVGILPAQGIFCIEVPRFVDALLRMVCSPARVEQKAAATTVERLCTSASKHPETRAYVQGVMKDSRMSSALLCLMSDKDATLSLRGFAASGFEATLYCNDDEQKACAAVAFDALSSMLDNTADVDFDVDSAGTRITVLFCTLSSCSSVANVHAAVALLKTKLLGDPSPALRLLCIRTLLALYDLPSHVGSSVAIALVADVEVWDELNRPLHLSAALLFDDAIKHATSQLLERTMVLAFPA